MEAAELGLEDEDEEDVGTKEPMSLSWWNDDSFESRSTDTSKYFQTQGIHMVERVIRSVCFVSEAAAFSSTRLVNSARIMPSTTTSSCSCFPCACNGCVSSRTPWGFVASTYVLQCYRDYLESRISACTMFGKFVNYKHVILRCNAGIHHHMPGTATHKP